MKTTLGPIPRTPTGNTHISHSVFPAFSGMGHATVAILFYSFNLIYFSFFFFHSTYLFIFLFRRLRFAQVQPNVVIWL